MTPAKPESERRNGRARWRGELSVLDEAVVGSVQKDAFDRGWWAYGWMGDFQDTPLGLHSTERKARREVERWVKENQ